MRWLLVLMAAVGLIAAGFLLGSRREPREAPPTVLERLRAVSRLQVLDVSVTRKVTLRPEPVAQATLPGALAQWARFTVAPPSGTALVAAEAHFSLDLSRLRPDAVQVRAGRVELTLPAAEVAGELAPEQTQVLASNLDSEQTTALLAAAQRDFARSLANDPRLGQSARLAAERSLGALVLALGFQEVRFNHSGGEPAAAWSSR